MVEGSSKEIATREGVPAQQGTLLTLAALGLIVEHLDQPIFAKDRNQHFVLVNGAFCDLVESTRSALLHQSECELMPVTPPSSLEQAVFERGTPTSGLRTFTTSSGAPLVRHTTFVPLIDSKSDVTHVVGVVGRPGEPVTHPDQFQEELERYAVERTAALRAMQQDLLRRERMWVLSQMAAGLAHQLRNHLGAIISAISIIRKHINRTDKVAHVALDHASAAAFESSTTIGDLLDYTKPRSAKPMVISLKDIVTDALELSPLPPGVVITSESLDLDVFVDAHQVRDALRKVVRNAYE